MTKQQKKAWSGRFKKTSNRLLDSFNASISFDKRLYNEDVEGSLVHARMLQRIGLLSVSELKKIQKGLLSIKKEIESGKFSWADNLEDIHMAIEGRLIQKIGPVGGKLHTARSRNDQVSLDMRLYCKKEILSLLAELKALQKVLVTLAQKKGFVPMPGYTHLQCAQPILLAHHLLAYFEMFQRDEERLKDIFKRVNVCPLGSGALAGSPFKIDRDFVAKKLGFGSVTRNSLDAVSDRDFVIELLTALSLVAMHTSRLAEELVLWSSQEFNFIRLPEDFCTGSSMMPQKVNPDVPELIRGKTGRVYGNLVALLTTLKGLPLAYNKDLQEDKEPLFDSLDTVHHILKILSSMLPSVHVNAASMKKATEKGFLLATDVADYLVSKGIPFRKAHEIVGRLVQDCIKKEKTIEELGVSELKKYHPSFGSDVKKTLNVMASINRRKGVGGTASSQVRKEIKRAKQSLR